MKITSLHINNFRGIREAKLDELGTIVIIAGQNGSGKSCIFDALRLIKSAYGGYQQNEWQQSLSELAVRLKNNDVQPTDFLSLFNDRCKPLSIECEFELSTPEVAYIRQHKITLLKRMAAENLRSRHHPYRSPFEAEHSDSIADREKLSHLIEAELENHVLKANLHIDVGQNPVIKDSVTLRTIFSTYQPQILGVIDYHGPNRNYAREFVQTINFDVNAAGQNRGHSALYNTIQKYSNVKSEMAASYIKDLIIRDAGQDAETQPNLTKTLQELFKTFFPDKEFLGPTASSDGTVEFNVKLSDGGVHDIDELSAGEKEIIYGYLRIRNTAPENSIILLDEPELHLNPKLIRALPSFYRTFLGESHNNQIWLVTHSDALLREVVGVPGYDVFHMISCAQTPSGSAQLKPLLIKRELDLALIDLVGDLATYHPTGKVVIFEGGGNSNLDRHTVSGLFPELSSNAMLISGTDKAKVKALHAILEKASDEDNIPFKFYSVTDADLDTTNQTSVTAFSWDVYHIENYFLNARYIRQALEALHQTTYSEEQINDFLKESAKNILKGLVHNHVSSYANRKIVSLVNTRGNPAAANFSGKVHEAAKSSASKIQNLISTELNVDALLLEENAYRRKLEGELESGGWISNFPGRQILSDFTGKYVHSTSYEGFRNLIFDRMKKDGFRPNGMEAVVTKILA